MCHLQIAAGNTWISPRFCVVMTTRWPRFFADSMARLDAHGLTPWIDARGPMQSHRDGHADHIKALNVLLGLDVTLEARPELLQCV